VLIEEDLDFSFGQAIVGVPEFRVETTAVQRGVIDDAQAGWPKTVRFFVREFFSSTAHSRANTKAREQVVRAQSSAFV
jgi:hypothetical protein